MYVGDQDVKSSVPMYVEQFTKTHLSLLAGTDFFLLTAAVAAAVRRGAGAGAAPEGGEGSLGAAVVLKLRPRPPANCGGTEQTV